MPEPTQKRVERTSQPETADRQPAQPLGVHDLINLAEYDADQQLEHQTTAKPLLKRQAATRERREKREIAEFLHNLHTPDVSTAQEAIIEQLDQLPEVISDFDELAKEQAKLNRILLFIETRMNNHAALEGVSFKKWLEQRDKQRTELEERRERMLARAAEARRAEATQEAHSDVERAQIVHEVLSQGGAAIHTDLPKEYSLKSDGFGTRAENKRTRELGRDIDEVFALEGNTSFEKTFGDRGIYEGVAFKPVTEAEYKDVKVEGQKKLFGRGPSTTRRKRIGEKPVLTSESVNGGGEEPAVEMVYRTFGDSSFEGETNYHALDGRTGNMLIVSIIMPESVARALRVAAIKDPSIIRDVVSGAIVKNIGISEKAWREGDDKTHGRPIQPPYDAWARANGGESRIYFQEPGAKSFDPSRVKSFK